MPLPDCPFCSHQNPAGAKFCNECGSPLHLLPCGDCGAVNSLTDTHCWRCGGLLLPPYLPAQGEDSARAPDAPERQPAEFDQPPAAPEEDARELEQRLVALEQKVQGFEPVPRTGAARPGRVEHFSGESNLPDPRSLFVRADDPSPGRRHGFLVTAFIVVLGSAIAVGAYLRDRGGALPETAVAPVPSPAPRAELPAAPHVVPDVAPASAPATPPEPKAVDAVAAGRAASGGDETAAPAPEPSCPPAVEAMALCEWLARAKRD